MLKTDPQLKIRLPTDLVDWLKRQVQENRSKLASEIARAVRERMERVGKERS